jgi:hypothetical protein
VTRPNARIGATDADDPRRLFATTLANGRDGARRAIQVRRPNAREGRLEPLNRGQPLERLSAALKRWEGSRLARRRCTDAARPLPCQCTAQRNWRLLLQTEGAQRDQRAHPLPLPRRQERRAAPTELTGDRGTDGSNPSPSSGESANFRSLTDGRASANFQSLTAKRYRAAICRGYSVSFVTAQGGARQGAT